MRKQEHIQPFTIGVLADFNSQNLMVLLQKQGMARGATCVQAPFGQTINTLLDGNHKFWEASYDALVVWTLPQRAVPTFNKVLSFDDYRIEDLLSEVDFLAGLVEALPATVKTVVLPTWVMPCMERGLGLLDMTTGVGNALMRMNLRLAEHFSLGRRVMLLDAQRWVNVVGQTAFNSKLWYLSKTPFHSAVFQEASEDIFSALDGLCGRSKKIVILDLDNTVWGGIVGEVGWEKLRLGGHDPIGEAFVDFQKLLKRLTNRGVVLAIVSKNEENVALDAIRFHPEMVLKMDDFVSWRINWGDKAKNIVDLLEELNLGLESAVFLDDSPVERARVHEALPQVLVPDLSEDPTEYPTLLGKLRCFDRPTISEEDRSRTKMYVADRGRIALKSEIQSLDQWLNMLELSVSAEPLNRKNLERATQLLNKTNQMNLSTRRLTSADLFAWAESERHVLWTFRVGDKFGDYGLCGICSLTRDEEQAQIVDFLLSCRVMGRGVEESMLATAAEFAKGLGCQWICAEFTPSARNKPCAKWFESQANVQCRENRYVFSLMDPILFPKHIRMSHR